MNRVAANLPARHSSSSEEITMEPDGLQTFIDDVGLVVSSTDVEHEITKRVAKRLSDLLAGGYRLPPEVTRPSPVHHVTYPLYVAPDERPPNVHRLPRACSVGLRKPVDEQVCGVAAGVHPASIALRPRGGCPFSPAQLVVAFAVAERLAERAGDARTLPSKPPRPEADPGRADRVHPRRAQGNSLI
jgi:hypothetical protein